MFQVARMLNSETGRLFISILLGLGLATLFRKVCTDKNCVTFNGPVLKEVEGKTFQFSDSCYKYELKPTKCESLKKTVPIESGSAKTVSDNLKTEKPFSFLPFS